MVYIGHDVIYYNCHARKNLSLQKEAGVTTLISFYFITEYFYLKKKLYKFIYDNFLQRMSRHSSFVLGKNYAKTSQEQGASIRICILYLVFFFLEIFSSEFQISTIKSSFQDVSLIQTDFFLYY